MKKILTHVLAALLVSLGCEGGLGATTRSGPRAEAAVSLIRRRYAVINRGLAKRRVVKKELAGFSTEGGELAAYFDGTSVVKVAATHFGETGRSLEEFYFWDGKLIFVFRRRDTYDAPMSGRVSKTAEDRYYFDDGLLVRWINERGRAVAPGGVEYLEAQARRLDSAGRFVEGARSQKSVVEAPAPTP